MSTQLKAVPSFQSVRDLVRYAMAQVEEPSEAELFAIELLWKDRDLFEALIRPITESAIHRAVLAEVHAMNNRLVYGNRPSSFANSGEPVQSEDANVVGTDATHVDGGLGRLGLSILDQFLLYDRSRLGDATLSKLTKQRDIYRRNRIGNAKKEFLLNKIRDLYLERRSSDADRLRDVASDSEIFELCAEAGYAQF